MAHHLGIGQAQQLGDAAIHRPQGAVERTGKGHVVKRVNEFLETSLGALDDLGQLVKLLVGRSDAGAVVQIVQQVLQFRNFAAPSVHIGGEQNRQHQQANGYGPQVIRKALQPFPGECGQAGGQQHQEGQGHPPKPGFFFFQMSRSARRAFRLIFFFVHNCRHCSWARAGSRRFPWRLAES